jgi:hypothetical protein
MRKPAIVALIVLAGTISPIQLGVSFAQPAPAAAASSSLSTQARFSERQNWRNYAH